MSVEVAGPGLVMLTAFDAAAEEGVGVVLDEWRVAELLVDWREAWLWDGESRRVEFIAADAYTVAGIYSSVRSETAAQRRERLERERVEVIENTLPIRFRERLSAIRLPALIAADRETRLSRHRVVFELELSAVAELPQVRAYHAYGRTEYGLEFDEDDHLLWEAAASRQAEITLPIQFVRNGASDRGVLRLSEWNPGKPVGAEVWVAGGADVAVGQALEHVVRWREDDGHEMVERATLGRIVSIEHGAEFS